MEADILLIDDDKDITNLLRIYLENEQYCVHIANDGEEGMVMIAKLPVIYLIL